MDPKSGANSHRHPSYIAIWVVLIVALFASVGLALLHQRRLAAILIFVLATIKAFLVIAYYMHLKWEPRFVALVVAAGFLALAILFFGLMPDIVHVYGR
jgi:caa(3)-type oxidase subunit IV